MQKSRSNRITTDDSASKLAKQKADRFMRERAAALAAKQAENEEKRRIAAANAKNKGILSNQPPKSAEPVRLKDQTNKNPVPKGRNHKPKRLLAALLDEHFPGYQPVVAMARTAHLLESEAHKEHQMAIDAEEELIPSSALDLYEKAGLMHEKVAKYVTPQLKAVDVTSNGETIGFSFSIIPPPKVINEK